MFLALKPPWLTWPRKAELLERWPIRVYLERRYGMPVPLATGHRIINGRSGWSWTCPHCGRRNDEGDRCDDCAAVFDGTHYRAKKAAW
jgi:predicted RNA-binding Zn-ribbon protein involved in translation (DUF1610 family)